ncbi:MAG: hypothetical protein JXR65_03990 [Bacteroidales bacterium]|nr:hypothetical protein [Bacteroidales bacterium]
MQTARPERLEDRLRRRLISAHQGRRTHELIEILQNEIKFPYDEPLWFLIKNINGCLQNNPRQVQRIADSLYAMTAEETVIRLESAPKLNTQMGPMFTVWLKNNFETLELNEFRESSEGIFVLNSSEEEGKTFVNEELHQDLKKRPDLVAKVNQTYIVGEAKWIGSPGGNQDKQVEEVLDFCRNQRGDVIRAGIIDGFPWSIKKINDTIINFKAAVQVQESEYDIVSSLLLVDYLGSFL